MTQPATTAAPPSQDVLRTVQKALDIIQKYQPSLSAVHDELQATGSPRGFLFRLILMSEAAKQGQKLGPRDEKFLMEEMARSWKEMTDVVRHFNRNANTAHAKYTNMLLNLVTAAKELSNVEAEWEHHITATPAGTLEDALATIHQQQAARYHTPAANAEGTVERILAFCKYYDRVAQEITKAVAQNGGPVAVLSTFVYLFDVLKKASSNPPKPISSAIEEKTMCSIIATIPNLFLSAAYDADNRLVARPVTTGGEDCITVLERASREFNQFIIPNFKAYLDRRPGALIDACRTISQRRQPSAATTAKPTLASAVQKYLGTHEGTLDAIRQQLWGERKQNGMVMEYVPYTGREKEFDAIGVMHKKLEDIGNGGNPKPKAKFPLDKDDIDLLRCALADTADRNFPNRQPGLQQPVDKALQDMKRLVQEIKQSDYLLPGAASARPAASALLSP